MENERTYRVNTSSEVLYALNDCRRAAEETEIILSEGDYYLDKTFTLSAEYRNLTIRGEGKCF